MLSLLAFLFSTWLMFHTFSYDGKTHEIKIAYKLWSDFGAHIPLIRSFSMGDNLPRFDRGWAIEYPIYPGEPIRYHFIFDMIVGLLEKAGLRIDWALNVPSALGFFGLMLGIYLLAKNLFKSSWVALLSVIFFLFNGSLGFLRFFKIHPLSTKIFSDIFHARDFPAFAPWGAGDVTAFWNLNIYTNQRHLAIAFALALTFILTLLRIEKYPLNKQLPWALFWGMVFAILPYFHQPTLLIVAIFMMCYFLFFARLRMFLLITGAIAAMLVVPQLFTAQGGIPGVVWHPGYIIHNDIIKMAFPYNVLRMVTFWWHNLGLHTILIPMGFFLIPKRVRLILLPIIPLFLLGNLFKFSVEVSANHKFFNFVMILGQMISAYTLIWFFQKAWKLKNIFLALLVSCLLSLVTLSLTLSGIIDFFVVANDTKGSVRDIPSDEVATWIAQNTPKDAVFLNSSYLYHPASIAGRPIFLGWPYFAWSAGYKENRMPVMNTLYETRDDRERCDLLKKRNISYVTAEEVKNDTNLPNIDLAYYLKTFSPIFTSRDNRYAIFTTGELCKK